MHDVPSNKAHRVYKERSASIVKKKAVFKMLHLSKKKCKFLPFFLFTELCHRDYSSE